MTKLPRSRELIFDFLGLKKVFEITPNYAKASDYYDGLEVEKGNIYKALVEEEYVTFYEFEIIKNGIKIRSIFKRFRDFISIQQAIERWMKNTQIVYKSITLPQKHLYKSETKRHSDLKIYLESLLSIKEAYKIYEINRFFMMGAKYDGEGNGIGLSIIRRQASNIDEEESIKDILEESGGYEVNGDQRMSLLIEELGD